MPVRDVRVKQIAKYKSLKEGNLTLHDELDGELLDMAEIKRLAFEDSSIEEMEREVISDLSERGMNVPEMNFGRQSDDSEALLSVRSSENYWKEKLVMHGKRVRSMRA